MLGGKLPVHGFNHPQSSSHVHQSRQHHPIITREDNKNTYTSQMSIQRRQTRVPTELLREILREALDGEHVTAIGAILLVGRTWYIEAMEDHRLWTTININYRHVRSGGHQKHLLECIDAYSRKHWWHKRGQCHQEEFLYIFRTHLLVR